MRPSSELPSPAEVQVHLRGPRTGGGFYTSEAIRVGELIPIAHGLHLRAQVLRDLQDDWARREVVTIARALATAQRVPHAIFVGRTAAALHGLGTLNLDGDIDFWTPLDSDGPLACLPAITLDSRIIAHEARVRRLSGSALKALIGTSTQNIAGAWVPSIDSVVATACLTRPTQESFVIACSATHELTQFDPFRQSASRELERSIRERLERTLAQLPKGTRSIRRARWVVENCDAGCDNPAESALLWILRDAGVQGTVTQLPLRIGGHDFFVDIGIPEAGVAFEFDGEIKDGFTQEDRVREARWRRYRQELLESAGYLVIRFSWYELFDQGKVLAKIHRTAAQAGRIIRRDTGFAA